MRNGVERIQVTAPYRCNACGLEQVATVESIGYAVGLDANTNARRDARGAVPMLLALAKCPRCGHHDPKLAGRNRRTRAIAIAACAVILLGTATLLFAMPDMPIWIPAIATVFLVIPLLPLRAVLLARYPTDATGLVSFADPPPPPPPMTPEIAAQTAADGSWKWM